MTWPLPPLDSPSLAELLAARERSLRPATLAALGALLGSRQASAEDDRLPERRLDADALAGLLRLIGPGTPPTLRDSLPRVVRSAFERVEPWLDVRRRQGLHRGVLVTPEALHLRGSGAALELGRAPGEVRADPLEELAMLLVALELAGEWTGAEALLGSWLVHEHDPRAVMLVPLLKVVATLRHLDDLPALESASPRQRSAVLRHAWSQVCAPARRPRLLLVTGSTPGLRSAVGHALLSRLRGALLLVLEDDAPEGEWLGPLSGALSDLQLVIMTAHRRPPGLDAARLALVCRCDELHLVDGASPFPAPVRAETRRMEARLPEEVLATAILSSIR
jgi:hypothetical protein